MAASLPEKKDGPSETSADEIGANIAKSQPINDYTLDDVNPNINLATAVASASQTFSQKVQAAKDEVEWEDVDDDAGVNCESNDWDDLGSDDYEWITSTCNAHGLAKNDVSATNSFQVEAVMKSYRVEDWFEKLFGFNEKQLGYGGTQQSFRVDGDILTSRANRRSYRIGTFACESLKQQRARVMPMASRVAKRNGLTVEIVLGDVSRKHAMPENKHATFQVASQLNCLEFVGPRITPEHGVTGYMNDRTQGPACSIACGPATVFRNYFAKVRAPDGSIQTGQTARAMIDNLRDFSEAVGNDNGKFFHVMGGYTMANMRGMQQLSATLTSKTEEELDALRDVIRVGVHADVQVTSHSWGGTLLRRWPPGVLVRKPPVASGAKISTAAAVDEGDVTSGAKAATAAAAALGADDVISVPKSPPPSVVDVQTVTQVLCSAVAAGYNYSVPTATWAPFGRLLLEAAYEATLLAAIEAAVRHYGQPAIKPAMRQFGPKREATPGCRKVFLTLVGGGVFGNPLAWILDSIERACLLYRDYDLQVCIVNYDTHVDPEIRAFVDKFERERQSRL